MIIIYDLLTSEITEFKTRFDKVRQHLEQRYMPKWFKDRGEHRLAVPVDKSAGFDPAEVVTYTWVDAESLVGGQEVRNRPVGRLIVADPAPVLIFNPAGKVIGCDLADGTHFTLGDLLRLDHSGG